MKQKYSLILDDEFIQYCKLNGIEDIEKEAKAVFKKGFDIAKYGVTPTKTSMVSNEIIPVTPLSEPNGLEILGYRPPKEEAGERRPKNKDIVIAEQQPSTKPIKKDLYDEG